ncbi:MAG TPA: CsgE family curli-type amyloid fiber assembly protein [bacterium]|nr:CsgE family curli-type amyloid fiber assembly protein [bacterium]HPN45151.1 CsgE family curli-type amyloid fiber assembly protein [bacterium]
MKKCVTSTLVTMLCVFMMTVPLYTQTNDSTTVSDKEKKSQNTKALLEKLLQEARQEVQQQADTVKETEQTETVKNTRPGDVLEIDGLIINDTKTKIGQEFYEYFYTLWEPPAGVYDYTIYISEMPTGQSGSWVFININDISIYQNRLTPRSDEIEEAARQATGFTGNYLVNYTQDQKQMAGDDMAGTGIY